MVKRICCIEIVLNLEEVFQMPLAIVICLGLNGIIQTKAEFSHLNF